MMEVVPLPQNGGQEGPRKRHNVAEWSRMDHLTGMLEHARIETDHWTSNTPNTTHQYGKVVDKRARNRRDGSVEQVQQTKQLEVFQAHIPGGSVQVIRSQTSSWSNTKQVKGGPSSGWPPVKGPSQTYKPMNQATAEQPFDDLQLSSSPLDLTSQKMKANIGRSGSIGGRRPPTRPRSTVLSSSNNINEGTTSSRLSGLSGICEELHRRAETQSFGKTVVTSLHSPNFLSERSFENGFNDNKDFSDTSSQISSSLGSIKITEITNGDSDINDDSDNQSTHYSLNRQKSSSIEDMKSSNLGTSEKTASDTSSDSNWRRGSKARRSLQIPATTNDERDDSSRINSVSKLRQQLETKHGNKQMYTNWSNLNELEGVVQKIKQDIENEAIRQTSDSEDGSKEHFESRKLLPARKKDSFITVESLNEIRERLKPLNPEPTSPIVTEPDDGIVTESKPMAPSNGKVKSFVYGMEIMLQKPKINGTGSLESRSSSKSSSSSSNRSEEWYNRRKSYGFEQMHSQNAENQRGLKEDSKVESSTDSGICRSSEIVAAPIVSKLTISKYDEVMPKSLLDTREGKPFSNQFGRKTTVTLGDSANNQPFECHRRSFPGGKIQEALRSLRETSSSFHAFEQKRKSEPITISIPIIRVDSNSDQDTSKTKTHLHRQLSSGTAVSVESSPMVDDEKDSCRESDSDFNSFVSEKLSTNSTEDLLSEHSDSSMRISNDYSTNSDFESDSRQQRPTSVQIFSDDETLLRIKSPPPLIVESVSADEVPEDAVLDKKQRKVEFSKTEIHFAAEPGKLNIVETDGKPPPMNIYRRRRRHSKDHTSKNNTSEIRFGDSHYEKCLLKSIDSTEQLDNDSKTNISYRPISVEEIRKLSPSLNETHNKIIDSFTQKYGPESSQDIETTSNHLLSSNDNESVKLRSILKNHSKPEHYLFGEKKVLEDTDTWKSEAEPLNGSKNIWCSSVNIKSIAPSSEENEIQKLLKSLKPATRRSIDIPEVSRLQSSSIAADNGLEVRISSMKPVDKRRASWSVPDKKSSTDDTRLKGFSTKVNFGAGETTVVKSPSQNIPVNGPTWFQSQSYCDNRLNNSKCQEKLIVRIGEGSSKVSSSAKDLPKFSHNFNRFSAKKIENTEQNVSKCSSSYQNICDNMPEFKSASLVMETMKSPTMQSLPENNSRGPTNVSPENIGPSTVKNVPENSFREPRSISCNQRDSSVCLNSEVTASESAESLGNMLGVESTKLSFLDKSKNDPSGIPSVLSVLDDLKKTIDKDITEITRHKSKKVDATNSIFRIKNVFRALEDGTSPFRSPNASCDKKLSAQLAPSQLSLLKEILDNGELSDDSLKADEEVRAYMSHANDEDELSSEVSGSWSRVKAIKYNRRLNLANKLLTTQNGDDTRGPPVHRVVAVAKVDSYDREPSNLHAVETLVCTKSGVPKITSISLKYDEGSTKSKFKPLNFSSQLSKSAAQTSEPLSVSDKELNSDPPKIGPEIAEIEYLAEEDDVKRRDRISDFADGNEEIPIPVIVERKSNVDASPKLRKGVSKSAESKMPVRQSANPPRKTPSMKKTEAQEFRASQRHRSLSPTKESNISSLAPRATKSQERCLKPEIKLVEMKIKREKPDKSRVLEVSQKRNIFNSGRDSWLNMPKDNEQRHCSHHRQSESHRRHSKSFNVESGTSRGRLDSTGAESSILEELTKAADEILLAVNGCTDDESRVSSDDGLKHRDSSKDVKPLSVISENPPARRLRTAERSEARLKSRTKISTESSVLRGSKHSIDERNRRRQARVLSKEATKGGNVASSSEDIESAAENAATKMKRVVRRIKSQTVKTVHAPKDPASSHHKPRERVYQMDHRDEKKKTTGSSTRENVLQKKDCSSTHRRKKPSEPVNKTDDLRINSNSHSESRKDPHRTIRGSSSGQKYGSRDKKTTSSSKSQIISSS